MSEVDQFKSYVSQKLSNKGFSDREDTVRKNWLGNKSGSERQADGITGEASISARKEGSTFENIKFIADVKLPYRGDYRAKNFIGVQSEYRRDDKSCTGTVQFRLTKSFWGLSIENYQATGTDPGGGHDSTRMCLEGINEDVVQALKNG